jgi:mRNA interferase HigB
MKRSKPACQYWETGYRIADRVNAGLRNSRIGKLALTANSQYGKMAGGGAGMRIVHWGRARRFFQEHKQAEAPLKQWRTTVRTSEWKDFADVRRTYTTADWVDGKIVFDIKGNDYRLIAVAQFENGAIYIRHVLTHEEYSEGTWK